MVAPLVAAAGISAAGSLLGGLTGGKGAKKAAKIQAKTAAAQIASNEKIAGENTALVRENRDKLYTFGTPALDRGNQAGAQINALLGLGGTPAQTDALAGWRAATGYQDTLDQGLKAANQGYAARGMLESGAAQKGLAKYAAGLADQSFGGYLNALGGQQAVGQQAFGAIAGVGNSATNALTGINTQTLQMNNAANQNAADAASNAALAKSAAQQNALAGLAGAAGGFLGQSSYGGQGGGAMPGGIYNPNNATVPNYLSWSPFGR